MPEIKRPTAPEPKKVQLGNGVVVINFNPDDWDDKDSILLGATRGGGSYNVEKTNRAIRFDGDRGENTKDLKVIDEWIFTLVTNILEVDLDNIKRAMPGTIEEVEESQKTPGYRKLRPNVQYKEDDYFKNVAYITQSYAGNVVGYVIENALGDGNLSATFEDKNEVVPEVTFTGHFDRKELDKVPTYIVEYLAKTEEAPDPQTEN